MASYKVSYKGNNFNKLTMKKPKHNGTMSCNKKSYAEVVNNNHKDKSTNNVSKSSEYSRNSLQLECVSRITAIPIVEVGLDIGGKLYSAVKDSNALTSWTLSMAESSLMTYVKIATPAVKLFNRPIASLDRLVCRSLDFVERKAHILYLPPELIYVNAQEYVQNAVVRPVLQRADSVKQMGSAVLDSKITAYAATTVEDVLQRADVYVDKYLPLDEKDADSDHNSKSDEVDGCPGPRQQVVRTVKHADRLSRKLGRRLSRRTNLEMKALKSQTTEAINILVYAAELIVKDPKLAYEKAKSLWAELSKDEPGNQARPETLEQFIALLTRETARKIVHLINYVNNGKMKLPENIIRRLKTTSFDFLVIANMIIQYFDIAAMKKSLLNKAYDMKIKLDILLQVLYKKSEIILEYLAVCVAGGSQLNKRNALRYRSRNNHFLNDVTATINGVN